MSTKENPPAENSEHASGEHVSRVDPETFGYQLFEHIGDLHGDENADLYLARVVAELFELSPILREHVSDLIIADLTEELHRRGQPDAAKAVLEVQTRWGQEAQR